MTRPPRYPYQEPKYLCKTKPEVRQLYGEPGFSRELYGDETRGRNRFANTCKLLGNPIVDGFERDNIVNVTVPGFGPDKNRTQSFPIHVKLKPLVEAAFQKVLQARLPYVLHEAGGHYFRYKLNDSVKAVLVNRPEYADLKHLGGWNIRFAERDLRNQAFDELVDYGREKVPKKELLSNHSFGSAIDINSETNPFDEKREFDMPRRIVRIFESLGFYWGGYYHDYMHFEYERSRILGIADESPPQVLYPFSSAPQRRESPLKYYFLNEAGTGGYFPLGKQQNLHGGVHLEPDSQAPRVPVTAAMPGYIVAARLMTPGREGNHPFLLQATEGRPLGFVLVRHELSELQNGQPADKTYPLYSLYMHLESPQWGGAPSDQALEKAPWLATFLKMQHGAVVNLDPASEHVGKTFWAQEPLNPRADSFKVHDSPQPLPALNNGRVVALTKPSPAAVQEAIEALRKGAIVTFDRPLFPVAAGETLGFLAPGSPVPRQEGSPPAAASGLPRYLHWELFSLSGDGGALQFLSQKDEQLRDLLLEIAEQKKDNFLLMPSDEKPEEENEINTLFGSTGVDIVPELTHAGYGRKLQGFLNDGRKFFSAQGTQDTPFTWPLQLTLNNKYKYPGEQGRQCTLEVLYKKGGQPLSKEVLPLSPRGQGTLNVTLNVPAAADALALWSQDFFTDAVEVSEATLRQKRLESRTRLFQKAAGHRWRNLVLDHVNEWTPGGLELQLKARNEAGHFKHLEDTPDLSFEDLKKVLRPLCWWARPASREDPLGEVPVLGDGQRSLFGTAGHQLPEDAQIVNMHPVTALWLIDLLLEKEAITLRKEWPPAPLNQDESNQQPPYLGLLSREPAPQLGLELRAILVQHGYGTTQGGEAGGVSFWLAPKGGGGAGQPPQVLCRAPYTEGVAMARLRLPVWGSWEVYATSEDGQRLEPARLQNTTFEVRKPELTGQPFTLGSKPGTLRPLTTGAFVVRDHWPLALEGYVVLDYWKAPPRGQPDLAAPPVPSSLAMPAVAARPPAERTAGGLKFKNDVIVGRDKGKGNPKVTPNFSYMEFVSRPPRLPRIFDGNEQTEFALHVPLAQRLQELRDLCKPAGARGKDLPLLVKYLARNGLSLLVGPSSGTAADLELLVAKLPLLKPSELFTAERADEDVAVRLTYTPPATSSGPLQFELDLAPALGRLAAQALSQPGETLHIRPRFVAPNGGHTLHTTGRLPPVEGLTDVFAASAGQLQAACGNDFVEVVADRCLPPVALFAFGQLEVKMGAGRLRTEVRLHGDANAWSAAAPIIKVSGSSQSKRQGGVLVADWPLMDRGQRVPTMWSGPLKFSAEVTQPGKVTTPPPPVTLELEVKPALESLTHEVRDKELWLVGQGRFIPTDADFRITCQKLDAATGQWVADTILDGAVRYKTQGDPQHGRCTEAGLFEASIPKLSLKKAGSGPFRFTWRRRTDRTGAARPVLGAVLAEPSTPDITSAELGL